MTIPIKDCCVIDSGRHRDLRGYFRTIFKIQNPKFGAVWGKRDILQVNMTDTLNKGSIRGMHMQDSTAPEAKLVTCISGRVFDVVVDVRANSETFGKWFGIELTSENNLSLFVPEGCAHGFQTLENHCRLLYLHSARWVKSAETGLIWNDSNVNIQWPLAPTDISSRDQTLQSLEHYE